MAVKFINAEEAKTTLPEGVSLLNIFAEWCGPCKMLSPVLEEVSTDTPVFKVDLDANKDFAVEMGVQGVPTTFIMKDGKVVDKLVGFVPMEEITSRVTKAA